MLLSLTKPQRCRFHFHTSGNGKDPDVEVSEFCLRYAPRTPTESGGILVSANGKTAKTERSTSLAACMDCVELSASRLKYLPVYSQHFLFISTDTALEDRVEYRVFKRD